MKECLKLIKKAKKIAIFSHESPDPDTIGSSLALCRCLESLGKEVGLFCGCEMTDNYNFLEYYVRYNTRNLEDYDLFIAVDVASDNKLGTFSEDFLAFSNTIKIDHHAIGTDFARINVVKTYSACAILIYEIAKLLKVKITQEIATELYFGICGDTSIFRNNNTDSKTFEVCAELFKAGADYRKVYGEFFDKKTVNFVKLTSNALLNASINDEYKFVSMVISASDYKKFEVSDQDDFGNLPKTYLNCGYKIAVIFKEKQDGIHCSFRSKFEYDVAKIAEVFGGGGHKNASGCNIKKSLKQAVKDVEEEIINYLKANN